MITKITPYRLSLHSDEHMIIVEAPAFNPKSQRVLVSVNNKVAEGIFDPKSKKISARVTTKTHNQNNLIPEQLLVNPEIRVKAFVYDFVN